VKQSNLVKDYFEFELPTEDFDKDLSSDEIYQVIPLARYLSPNASQLIKDQLKEKRNVDSFKKFKSLNLE
ncbi:MAG: hypothetical protein R2879_22415, partial [Saprospiraceae bacterium]